jgi:hypothetical protein
LTQAEFAPTLLDHTQNARFVQVILRFEAEDRALAQAGVHADQNERAEEWLGGGQETLPLETGGDPRVVRRGLRPVNGEDGIAIQELPTTDGELELGLGRLYRHAGDGARAREHLATAAVLYREMGMGFWLEKAEAEQATG